MSSVYKRGSFWWLAFKMPGGQRVLRSSGIPSTAPASEALKMLALVEKQLASETITVHSKMTVGEWAIQWTAVREGHKQTNAKKDFERLKLHVLPTLGGKRIGAVTTADVRALVAKLRTSELAPRTVINTYGLVRRLFNDAVAEALLIASPCVLKRKDLPKKRDKDPSWRAGAVFSREEAELLLTAPAVPLDRRVTYALGLLGGMREGEIAALKWSSLDRHAEPLSRLLVTQSFTRANKAAKSTKTGNPRVVPVHPVLERVLGEWQSTGFASLFGREPREGDLLVPNRHGGFRTDNTFVKGLAADLEALGMRHRTMHNTRRTFISLGRTDGANPAVLKSITHDQVGDQFDQYTTFTFDAQCEAVLSLKLAGRIIQTVAARATGTAATPPATLRGETMKTETQATGITTETSTARQWAEGDSNPPLTGRTKRSSGLSRVYRGSEGLARPLKGVERSNVATRAIEAELSATLSDFRHGRDRERLAARLRQLLIMVRR